MMTPSKHTTPRATRRSQVMVLLIDHGPMSITEISRELQLSRSYTGTIVRELESDGNVYQAYTDRLPNGVNRPIYAIREELN